MTNNYISSIYSKFLPDKRLQKRVDHTINNMVLSGSSIINQTSGKLSDKIGAYRMLSNDTFDYNYLLKGSFVKCKEGIDKQHVLCIQDTTEFNLSGIANKIGKLDPDIGPTSNNSVAGFFCHPVIAVSSDGSNIYGLPAAKIYNREWEQKTKTERKYKSQTIEEKESYRWIEVSNQTKERVPPGVAITLIGDRENDIYEDFALIPDDRTNVLIRSRCDRVLYNQKNSLYQELDSQSIAGTIDIKVKGNKGRTPRKTKLQIKFCKVEIGITKAKKLYPIHIELYAIEAKEIAQNVPQGEDPIHWRLLTTHSIECLDQAIQCINWYKMRWFIEELFRVIKTKGFEIESSQLSTGAAIKKLLAMTLEAAMHIMQMKLSLNEASETKTQNIFSPKQIALLQILNKKIEGNTQKQKNPYPNEKLSWATWILARLGNWSGYNASGPPGYITIKNGFDKFNNQFEIFDLFYNV